MAIVAGFCSASFRELSSDDVIRLAGDADLTVIEWGGKHLPPGDLAAADVIDTECADAGVVTGAYDSDYFAGSAHGFAGSANQDPDAVLDTAAELGARAVRVWAGSRPSTEVSSEDLEVIAEALASLCDEAASYQLQISIEYHPQTLADTPVSTLGLIERVNRDNLYVHWRRRPGLSAADAQRELALLANKLSYLHVFMTDDAGKREPLSAGQAFWPPLLRALAATSNRWPLPRWAVIECVKDDDPAQLISDAATLTRWLATI